MHPIRARYSANAESNDSLEIPDRAADGGDVRSAQPPFISGGRAGGKSVDACTERRVGNVAQKVSG